MGYTIFYSWQSDLPNNTNRTFIEDALGKAVKAIRNDDSIKVEVAIDMDTQAVPGAPDVANTILDKIVRADIVVCDVSIVNPNTHYSEGAQPKEGAAPRLMPNPNVMLELGYALAVKGGLRVILVQNTAF